MARVIVMHSTAGVFGGDRLAANIHVETGARAWVTSQSATKVHPAGDRPARQSLRLTVETGGELHYYVDPLIPFAGSRLRQDIHVELCSGARFFFWDGLMAGRIRSGESWRFAELVSQTAVYVDSDLAFLDRFELRPEERSPDRQWAMGRHGYLATAISFDPSIDDNCLESLRSELVQLGAAVTCGLDVPFDRLLVARFLAQNGSEFRTVRDGYRTAVAKLTGCLADTQTRA